jgi:O-antigen/teichoic acid export membrane protein
MRIWDRIMNRRQFVVGFVAQGLQYGASLLLLPLMVTRLSTAEIGIWYILLTAQGLATILDFGFNGAFARNIAVGMSGARSIQRHGVSADVHQEPNYDLVARIVRAARLWYLGISAMVLLVMLTLGLWYVNQLAVGHTIGLGYVRGSWCVMSFSLAFTLYFSWVNPVLVGSGRVEHDMISQIVNRGGFALLGAVMLLMGGGLLSLAVAQLIAVALGRGVAALYMRPLLRRFPTVHESWTEMLEFIKTLAPNASRFGFASLSGFIITRANVFAVSTFVGLSAAASYAISLQLISAVMQAAQVPHQVAFPKLVDAHVKADRPRLWRMTVSLTLAYVGLFSVGAAAVVLGGPAMFEAMGSHTHLLPTSLLFLMALVFLLEGVHWTSALVLLTGNRVPFVTAAIVSAVAVAIGSSVAGWMGWGVFGILAWQGIVQLAYNNWKWPLVVYRETRV